MATRAFDETAEGWDTVAEAYAAVFAPFSAQFGADVVSLYPPRPSDYVLELAAGTGALTQLLSERAGKVLATDISPLMVRSIARLNKTNVDAAIMDGEQIDAVDASFDAVYCLFGVMYFSDRAKGLREIVRVLKPGGRCVIATWNPRSGVLRPLAEAVGKVMPGSPPAQALSEPPVLGTLEELQSELGAAGLERLEVVEASHALHLRTPNAYLNELLQAHPNGVLMRSKLPPEAYEKLAAELERDLQAQFGNGPVSIEGVANIVCSFKA